MLVGTVSPLLPERLVLGGQLALQGLGLLPRLPALLICSCLSSFLGSCRLLLRPLQLQATSKSYSWANPLLFMESGMLSSGQQC